MALSCIHDLSAAHRATLQSLPLPSGVEGFIFGAAIGFVTALAVTLFVYKLRC